MATNDERWTRAGRTYADCVREAGLDMDTLSPMLAGDIAHAAVAQWRPLTSTPERARATALVQQGYAARWAELTRAA